MVEKMQTNNIVIGFGIILSLTVLILVMRAIFLSRMRRKSLAIQREALARSVRAEETAAERRRRERRANRAAARRSSSEVDLETGLQRPATAHLQDGEEALPLYEPPPTYESLKFPLPGDERASSSSPQEHVEMSSSSTAPPLVPQTATTTSRDQNVESSPPNYRNEEDERREHSRPSTPRQSSPPPQSSPTNNSSPPRSIPVYRSLFN